MDLSPELPEQPNSIISTSPHESLGSIRSCEQVSLPNSQVSKASKPFKRAAGVLLKDQKEKCFWP